MKKIDLKPIGERIKTERKRKGLRQKKMAAELGISPNNLSDIENGKATPGADFLLKLHDQYNIDTEYLLHGKSPSLTAGNPGQLNTYDRTSLLEIDSIEKLLEFMNLSTFFKNSILALSIKFTFENTDIIDKILEQRKK